MSFLNGLLDFGFDFLDGNGEFLGLVGVIYLVVISNLRGAMQVISVVRIIIVVIHEMFASLIMVLMLYFN